MQIQPASIVALQPKQSTTPKSISINHVRWRILGQLMGKLGVGFYNKLKGERYKNGLISNITI